MKKEYSCVICGRKKVLYAYLNVEELLKVKPYLKNSLWWDMRINKLKKKVKVCEFCYLGFKELKQESQDAQELNYNYGVTE